VWKREGISEIRQAESDDRGQRYRGCVAGIDQMKSFLCYTITFPMAITFLPHNCKPSLKHGHFSALPGPRSRLVA
jgi:hypothetical protein